MNLLLSPLSLCLYIVYIYYQFFKETLTGGDYIDSSSAIFNNSILFAAVVSIFSFVYVIERCSVLFFCKHTVYNLIGAEHPKAFRVFKATRSFINSCITLYKIPHQRIGAIFSFTPNDCVVVLKLNYM